MQPEDGILGIFLATYSSRGDHLPLRYPLTQSDYEHARIFMQEAKAEEARRQSERASDYINSKYSTEEDDDEAESDQPYVDAGPFAKATPSRASSYISVGAADTSMSTPAPASAIAIPNSSGSSYASQSGRGNRYESDQAGISEDRAAAIAAAEASGNMSPHNDPERLFSGGSLFGEREKNASQDQHESQSMYGFDIKFLAQLFSPKPSMSNKRFQVAIGNALFLGHPLCEDLKEKAKDSVHYDTERDDADTMSHLASLTELDGWKVKSDLLLNRASRHRGRELLADLGLINLVLNHEPSEARDSTVSEGELAVRDSKEWRRRGYSKPVFDPMFHVVFMLDNTVPGMAEFANLLYEHVLVRLVRVLQSEQTESNYVLTESRLIRTLNDVAANEKYTPMRYVQELIQRSALAAELIKLYNGLRQGEVVNVHIRKRIMLALHIPRGPRLQRPLPPEKQRFFFNSGYSGSGYNSCNFADSSNAVSTVHTPRPTTPSEGAGMGAGSGANGSSAGSDYSGSVRQKRLALLETRFDVPHKSAPAIQEYWGPPMFTQSHGMNPTRKNNKARSFMSRGSRAQRKSLVAECEWQQNNNRLYPRIEPYHTIVILEDIDALKRKLFYADASPTLIAVIERASPTKTLATLHTMVDCSFAQLCRLVSHLVYWRVARVICPVNLSFTYVPTIKKITPELIENYNKQGFQLDSLVSLLASFHPPKPAAQILHSLTKEKAKVPPDAAAVPLDMPTSPPDVADDQQDSKRREQRAELRQILVFLLREGAIAQYHTWPLLLVPHYVKFDLSQEQFVSLALAWFRSLYTHHPDLLGAFPHSMRNEHEFDSWNDDERREQDCAEDIHCSFAEAETQVVLCRVMCKIALKRVRDKWAEKKCGKRGQELQRMERLMADEEDRVREFCDRVEKEKVSLWTQAKDSHDTLVEQMRRDRIEARRAKGKDIPANQGSDLFGPNSDAYKWYDFVETDPDVSELTKEIVGEYVTYVPTAGYTQRSQAERTYIKKLIDAKPTKSFDWFLRHSHLFNGKHHLVEITEYDKTSPLRLESLLSEFSDILLLPQHV